MSAATRRARAQQISAENDDRSADGRPPQRLMRGHVLWPLHGDWQSVEIAIPLEVAMQYAVGPMTSPDMRDITTARVRHWLQDPELIMRWVK